jgi:hypothetical protein
MQNISQQQKLSQMLLQQGMQQPQGQMVSGHYVAPALTQYLAPLFGAYAGAKGMETAEQKQLDLAKAIRQVGNEEVQNILQTYKTDPNAALQLASTAQTPQAKALAAQLSKSVLLEPTTEERQYKAALADGSWNPSKGGFNAFKNQMTDAQKEENRIAKARLNISQQEFNINNAPYNPAAFGQSVSQAMPQGAPTSVGSPIIKPTVGLAPNAPGYAQGALNLPTNQVNPQMPQAAQTLPQPPAWVRTQKDYKDWLKSESEPLNEFQGKAVLYGSGMLQANNVINQLASEGTTKGAVTPAFLSGIAALAPLGVGDAAVNAINAAFRADPTGLVGPDKNQQKLAQAQLGFAIPYLRQTSGANFGAKEVADTIAEYFPLRGESDEVAKQKEASRNRVIQGMKAVSGRGARQIDELGNITPAPTSGWGKAQVVNK